METGFSTGNNKSKTDRENFLAILRYQQYDRLPLVHFGFWTELLQKWVREKHLLPDVADNWEDGNLMDLKITELLGFDYNYASVFSPNSRLFPGFDEKVVKEFADGTKHIQNADGVTVLQRPEAGSIPGEIEHLLKDRASWEEHYKWRYQFNPDRIENAYVRAGEENKRFDQGGLEFLQNNERDYPYGIYCGSLYGQIRDVFGLVGISYLMVDDEALFDEVIETVAEMNYQVLKYVLERGAHFDFVHFWEDICFKNGPLISPKVFDTKIGPHYKKITDLSKKYGIDIVSVDCDGMIDELIPTWINNGVNTMYPIEVGTWNASIEPWREKYGKKILGVGGVDKKVFARDRAAIDAEIERLKPLVELGGYIPCPDHRLPEDAKWDLVQYYCEQMRRAFN